MVLALLLAALAGAPAASPAPPVRPSLPSFDPAPWAAQGPARVSVSRGRAMLVRGEDVRILVRDSEPVSVAGSAYVELGSRARAEIAFPGRGSLRVEGPAALEWSPAGRGETPVVELERFERLEVEVRGERFRLELPQAWAFDVRRAALALESLPSGALVVHHHGGDGVRVLSRVPRPQQDWPRKIEAGRRVRLRPYSDEG